MVFSFWVPCVSLDDLLVKVSTGVYREKKIKVGQEKRHRERLREIKNKKKRSKYKRIMFQNRAGRE